MGGSEYRDSLAAHTSLKRATGDTDADKDRAFEGEAGGDPDSPEARARKAETFGPDAGRTGPGRPEAPEAPKTPALGESGDINAELKKAMPGATDREVEAARAVAGGEEMPDVSDAKQARINALASKIRGGIKQIAEQPAAPGDIAAEQAKIDRIKKIDFGKGSMLDSIIHYKQDPDKLPIKGREKLLELAHSIRHNYDPGKYKAVEQFSLPSSVENRTVSRASGMLQGYVSVLRALRPFEEGQKIPSNVVQAWVAGHWSGDPKYYELESAIAQMGQETSAVTTGGVPRQGLTKMLLNEVSRTASPAQIRAALLTHMRNGWAFIDGYQRQYDNLTGGGDFVPGLGGRDNWNLFSSILRMNPYTGEVPEDAPDELKDVGKPYTERSGRIKTNPYEDFRPPRSDHIPDIRRYIKEHQNDRDPAVRADVERFKRMIGGTLHLPRMIPAGRTQPMPLTDEELLKLYGGRRDKKAGGDPAPEDKPAAAATEEKPFNPDDYWWERSGKGMRKAVAGAVTGIPRAVNAGIGLFSPDLQETLGDLAEKVPGVKSLEDFAQQPSESWAETIGGLGASTMMAVGGAPAKAATALPGVFQAGQGFGKHRSRATRSAAHAKPACRPLGCRPDHPPRQVRRQQRRPDRRRPVRRRPQGLRAHRPQSRRERTGKARARGADGGNRRGGRSGDRSAKPRCRSCCRRGWRCCRARSLSFRPKPGRAVHGRGRPGCRAWLSGL